MKRSLRRVAAAFSAALLVNGFLAIGMAFWADLGHPPGRPQRAHKPVEIPFVKTQRPKKKAETPRRRSRPAQVARAALPALSLPSAISIPVFDPQAFETPGVVHPAAARGVSGISEDTILTEDMLDEPPRPIARAPLRYPKSAEAGGVEGEVEARLLLSDDGSVLQVSVVSATPSGVFEAAARESLARWRFAPATFRGLKLKAWVRQRVVFKLQ
jgi:protein TonB